MQLPLPKRSKMKENIIEIQARTFVFDLSSSARECGFKADEIWQVVLASAAEKTSAEKQFFPVLSTKVLPEMLAELLRKVQTKLSLKPVAGSELDVAAIKSQQFQYLLAFSPKRLRR